MNARVDHAERIEAMRHLLSFRRIDIEAAMILLNTLPATLQESLAGALEHVRSALAAAPGGDRRHQAIARYALARFTVELEAAQPDTLLVPTRLGR